MTEFVGPHSEGEPVVRSGILLDRLKFSPGQISSSYNDNLAKAIAAFQSVSGLRAVGSVDAATWAALNSAQSQSANATSAPAPQQCTPLPNPKGGRRLAQRLANTPQTRDGMAPAVVPYIISTQDVSGPFTKIPMVNGRNAGERQMLREAKLHRLNFQSALDLLAEKFHSSPELLLQLNPNKRFHRAGEQIQVPNVLTSAPSRAGSVVVDASTHSVTVLDARRKVLAFYPATVGSEHDPLPVGNWTVAEVNRYPQFRYNPNLFWDSENKHPRAILSAGPRNPVGVVWIGLSKKHYGIHGTPTPSKVGKKQSHGCIWLTNWDASELANMVHPGTPVVLEEGTPVVVEESIRSELRPPRNQSRSHRRRRGCFSSEQTYKRR